MSKKHEKSTNAEIELRLATIYEMVVVKSYTRDPIVRYCSEKFGISSRQTDEYLKRIYEEIKETYGDDYKQSLLSRHLAKYDDLYLKNYMAGDFRECRNIIESINKLLGLGETNKSKIDVEMNAKVESQIDYSKLSTETLRDILANTQKTE